MRRLLNPSVRILILSIVVIQSLCGFLPFGSIVEKVIAEDIVPAPIAVFPESDFNFGTVLQGTPVKHSFIVQNKGNAPLIILSVRPACGCTTATTANTVIPPATQAEVVLTFDTTGFDGEKEKTARIITNDATNPQKTVSLHGYVEGTLVINPQRVLFGEVTQKQLQSGLQRNVTVSVKKLSDIKITGIRGSSQSLILQQGKMNDSFASFDIGISSDVTPGVFNERIFVETLRESGEKNSFVIPVTGIIKAPVIVQPRVLSFGLIDGQEKEDVLERSARVFSVDGGPLKIDTIKVSDPSILSYRLTPTSTDAAYVLTVRIDPKQVKKEIREKLSIKTSNIEEEELQVDVYGAVPAKL